MGSPIITFVLKILASLSLSGYSLAILTSGQSLFCAVAFLWLLIPFSRQMARPISGFYALAGDLIWGCAIAFNLFLSGNITFGFFALIALCPRIGLAFDLIPSECPKRDFIKWKFLKTRWILHMIVFPLVTIAYFIFPSTLKFPTAICLLAVGQFIADFYIYLNLHRAL